jgi:hypothetical protein
VFLAKFLDYDYLRRRRLGVAVGALVTLLALAEAVNAFVGPAFAPDDKAWRSAAAKVRAGFQPGDLIVAAPAWADSLMRLQLGDLVPVSVAARMDAARFARVWEISQRGAHASEANGARLLSSSRQGALTVRLWEKPAAHVVFDFLAEWQKAALSSVTPDRGELPCWVAQNKFQCGDGTSLGPELLEIDTAPRNGLAIEPHERTTTVLEYPEVSFGRELAVAGGLHNVWLRKSGDGKVHMRVLVNGRELGAIDATNLGGWALRRFDTSDLAGGKGKVRFEITTDKAHGRHFGFAAEARDP